MSSKVILAKLNGHEPSPGESSSKFKFFIAVAFTYSTIIAVCCVFQKHVAVKHAHRQPPIQSQNSIGDTVQEVFFNIIAVMLIIAIRRFRKVTNSQPGLSESKLVILMHLIMFLSVNLTLACYLCFQFAYVFSCRQICDTTLYEVSHWIHTFH